MTGIGWFITTCLVVDAMIVGTMFPPRTQLIWNASPSVPLGLYAIHPAAPIRASELVVVHPPRPLTTFMAARRYLPRGVPLLKHVAALPGQRVCRSGDIVLVDRVVIATALDHDRRGRSLPRWSGCRVLSSGEVFLLNRRPTDSFDGRYFGPLPASVIVGRADPVWIEGGR